MQRIWTHYEDWEDYQAGLYALAVENENDLTEKSRQLLANPNQFTETMNMMFLEWITAVKVNMTDTSQNRQAWLGQAACCFNHGAPEYVTKRAWWLLSDEQRNAANAAAQKIIDMHDKGEANAETLF